MMYRVFSKMSAVDSIPFLICNCPFDLYCKHEYAVIEKLLREGNLEIKEKEPVSKPQKKVVKKPKAKLKSIKNSSADNWRVVPGFDNISTVPIAIPTHSDGNAGLNLTKADYVYILDPWWNPAIEAQAIDRTHRIGQQKPIFAYKMICKDTIEEKIVKLQAKKKKLASDLIQVDENVFKSLEKDDLMALFD